MNETRRPSMNEVARLAGVSHQTVSRVLNESDQVRPETRDRVWQAVEELGYRRNLTARALVTQRSALLGVVWSGAGYHGPSSTIVSIEVAARAQGWASIVAAVRDDDDLGRVVGSFWERGVEGLVIVAPHGEMVRQIRDHTRGLPTVLVADMPADPEFHVVSVDQRLGAQLATRHLLARGADSVVMLSGSEDWFDARARVAGFRAEMEAAGMTNAEVVAGDWSAQCGYDQARALILQGLPQAVLCANDLMAMGMLAAFREEGLNVPEDVALIGFDDVDGAAWTAPPLTTVNQPFRNLGSLAIETLVGAVEGSPPGRRRTVDPELVVRGSA